MLFSVFALSAFNQNNTVIEPKIDAQTLGGYPSNYFWLTYGNYTGPTVDGTANQILSTDGAGTLSWILNAAATGIVGFDFSNPSYVLAFRVADTLIYSTGHTHTELLLASSLQNRRVTTVNAATYDLLETDYILHVTYTATGAVTSLTLPTAQVIKGRMVIIKDAGGLSGTNNITIDTEGSETIDGAATLVINGNYNAVTIYCDGTNWFINSKYN